MVQKATLPIREFARLTGINRENLRFYDRIGLLTPEMRGENRYRYYSRRQLGSAYLISNLRELEIGIEAIKRYSAGRTPERMLALFAQQEERINTEIERLGEIRTMMALYSKMARQALAQPESAVLIENREEEPLFFCPPFPVSSSAEEEMISSYDYAAEQGVNLGYPLGAVVSRSSFQAGEALVAQYYFKQANRCNGHKPAGRYAVAYGRCDPWQPAALYRRLLDFVEERGLILLSDVYEEGLLDDMSNEDPEQNCTRIEVLVAPWRRVPQR